MTLLLIALGVSMDAMAVAGGIALRGAGARDLFKLALTFGVFQFAMSLLGALGGTGITRHFGAFDHWIAFALLGAVGGKMIWEALSHEKDEAAVPVLTAVTLLTLGVATSVDALAVGLTLPTLGLNAWLATGLIGVVTFGLSLGGAWAGKRLGDRFGASFEVLGGVVLVGLGCKTLLEHLAQG